MKRFLVPALTLLTLTTTLFTSCKKDDFQRPPVAPAPQQPPAGEGYVAVKVKAVITVGDVVYDSIPATYTITTWDAHGVQHRKDTTVEAGAQNIYLRKEATRYSIRLNKWGLTDEKVLEKADVNEGALYQLGGRKEARQLQWVTKYSFVNGAYEPAEKQQFTYDAQGRIKEVHEYARDPKDGVLRSGSSQVYVYEGNKLRVNNTSKGDGATWFHHAYTFDAQGRTLQSEFRYITEHHVYNNQYSSRGITMLMGENASDPNGARIVLQFAGGNRVEEKTIIPSYTTTVKTMTYDCNINPYAVIKMPSLYFELSSKNNVLTEAWEGSRQHLVHEYKYDAEGYITEVRTKSLDNNGQLVPVSKTVYTY